MKNLIAKKIIVATVLALGFGLVVGGCSTFDDNYGSDFTTKEGDPITEGMLIGGKWDLDGELTNTANGNPGVGAIFSDIGKDMFGEGWQFLSGGVFKADDGLGETTGHWRIKNKNQLIIQEDVRKNTPELFFEASFKSGYLYLKNAEGKFMVLERGKFFG